MHKFSQGVGLLLLAYKQRKKIVRLPKSSLSLKIFYIFYKEGLIRGMCFSENFKDFLVFLKYVDQKPLIKGFKFLSKPSCRIYISRNKLIKFFYGYGFFLISTSFSGMIFLHKYFNSKSLSKHGGQIFFQVYF